MNNLENKMNLSTMDAFNDIFPLVMARLNPREHCHIALVCKQFLEIMTQIWQQDRHNTLGNRQWMAQFYTLQPEELNLQIESMKMNAQQRILLVFYHGGGNNDANAFADFQVDLGFALDKVFNDKRETIQSTVKKIFTESLVHCCSVAQMKTLIEWKKDPFTSSLLAKSVQSQESEDILKLSELTTELKKEFEVQIAQLAVSPPQEQELKQELSTQEVDKINHQLIDINNPEWEQDTPENRLSLAQLFVENGHLSDQVQLMKTASIASSLNAIAIQQKIKVSDLSDKAHRVVNDITNKVYNNKLELIQSTLKEYLIETTVKRHPPVEIKRLITMYADPIGRSVMSSVMQNMAQFSATSPMGIALNKEIMQEVLEQLGIPAHTIQVLLGESNQE